MKTTFDFVFIKMNHPVVVGNWFSMDMDNCENFLNWMEQITGGQLEMTRVTLRLVKKRKTILLTQKLVLWVHRR